MDPKDQSGMMHSPLWQLCEKLDKTSLSEALFLFACKSSAHVRQELIQQLELASRQQDSHLITRDLKQLELDLMKQQLEEIEQEKIWLEGSLRPGSQNLFDEISDPWEIGSLLTRCMQALDQLVKEQRWQEACRLGLPLSRLLIPIGSGPESIQGYLDLRQARLWLNADFDLDAFYDALFLAAYSNPKYAQACTVIASLSRRLQIQPLQKIHELISPDSIREDFIETWTSWLLSSASPPADWLQEALFFQNRPEPVIQLLQALYPGQKVDYSFWIEQLVSQGQSHLALEIILALQESFDLTGPEEKRLLQIQESALLPVQDEDLNCRLALVQLNRHPSLTTFLAWRRCSQDPLDLQLLDQLARRAQLNRNAACDYVQIAFAAGRLQPLLDMVQLARHKGLWYTPGFQAWSLLLVTLLEESVDSELMLEVLNQAQLDLDQLSPITGCHQQASQKEKLQGLCDFIQEMYGENRQQAADAACGFVLWQMSQLLALKAQQDYLPGLELTALFGRLIEALSHPGFAGELMDVLADTYRKDRILRQDIQLLGYEIDSEKPLSEVGRRLQETYLKTKAGEY